MFVAVMLFGCGGGSSGPAGTSSGGSGGGASNGGSSGSPPPQIQVLSPSNVMVGIPQGLITVYGTNFTPDAQAYVDGASVITIVQNSGSLEAQIDLSLSYGAGTHELSVHESAGNSDSLPLRFYAPTQGPQPFLAVPAYSAGPEVDPGDIAVADLDGDGIDDVVLPGPAISNSPSLAILKGQRNGTLSPVSYVTGVTATALATGDVDGNGKPDIVALSYANGTSSSLTTLLNQGQGNFTQVSNGSINGIFPGPAALDDIYGTGSLDLIVSVKTPNSILLFRNTGGGRFGSPTAIATTAADNRNFSVADFNNDGFPDVVYTAANPTTGADEIHILAGQGGGASSDMTPASLSGITGYISVIDANNDGCPDLAVQSPIHSTAPLVLKVFLGHCDGTFSLASSAVIAPAGFAPYHLLAGDFDHDGFPDLAGVNGETEPSHILYLWGDGTGNFVAQQVNGPMGFVDAVGDVNGDGIPDVIVPDRFNEVSLSLGRGDRAFPSATSLAPANAGAVSIGDVNGDGLPDLLFAGDPIGGTPGTVFLNEGNGQFVLSGNVSPNAFLLADLNGDGLADLIGSESGNLVIWPGSGDPSFQSTPVTIAPPDGATVNFGDLQSADIDSDGHPDLIASGVIFFGLGNFQFDAVQIPLDAPLAIGDFNGDGKLDLAGPSQTLLNQGNRQFRTVNSNLNMTVWPLTTPVVADFNGDGVSDVAWVDGQSASIIDIAYGRGDGSFYLQGELTGGQYAGGIAVGDFNGDGRLDILAGLEFAEQLVLYTNDGQGGFEVSYFASGANTNTMACADLNKDGKPDVVIVNYGLSYRPPNALLIFGQ
ncbi:MAG TPA: VCBS repeat-containing protein [Candidatus Dormibacteraeota bacterium]|nr:VCBS repeat-containing protein [Candidatus Dormibacteraeota bacterium]